MLASMVEAAEELGLSAQSCTDKRCEHPQRVHCEAHILFPHARQQCAKPDGVRMRQARPLVERFMYGEGWTPQDPFDRLMLL